MIPSYSPQARGRSERNFSTWQGRPPQELRLRGIRTLEEANVFPNDHCIAEFNRRFTVPAAERGTAFISKPEFEPGDDLHERIRAHRGSG